MIVVFLKISKSAKRGETRGLSVPSGPARGQGLRIEFGAPSNAILKKFYHKISIFDLPRDIPKYNLRFEIILNNHQPHAQNLKIKTSKYVFFQFFKIFEFFRFFPLFTSKKMSKKVICNKTFDSEGRNRSNYAQNDRSFF